jgi:hypothetical protein
MIKIVHSGWAALTSTAEPATHDAHAQITPCNESHPHMSTRDRVSDSDIHRDSAARTSASMPNQRRSSYATMSKRTLDIDIECASILGRCAVGRDRRRALTHSTRATHRAVKTRAYAVIHDSLKDHRTMRYN